MPPKLRHQETSSNPDQQPNQHEVFDARLGADALSIMNDPAVDALTDIDRHNILIGQTRMYQQQTALGYMLVQGVIGNYTDLRSGELLNTLSNDSTLSMMLRSTNEFHSGFVAYSRAQNKPLAEQTQDIVSGNVIPNITLATRDLMELYRQGFIKPDGNSNNMQYAGRVLRFMTTNLLFAPIDNSEFLGQHFDDLYTFIVNDGKQSREGRANQKAHEFAAEYARPITRGQKIRTIRTRLGNTAEDVTNRAALSLILGNAKAAMLSITDIEGARQQYTRALTAIGECPDIVSLNARMVDLVKRLETSAKTEKEELELTESVIQATELSWEVLPEGDLGVMAREIVNSNTSETKQPAIDLTRLQILARTRERWGKDASFYVRGKLGKRKVIKEGDNEEPDQYLLLILQDIDPHGKVIQEHAVAVSPIAGPNALYVFRQDVSEGLHWREVMALPKKFARDVGARAVKHTVPRGAPESYLVPSMTEKVATLLASSKEEFPLIEFNGERGFRIRKRELGSIAITGVQSERRENS